MKTINLLAAATALVMAATPAFAANWNFVEESINSTVFYYDVDTIKRSGNQVTVWEKWDHSRNKTEKSRQQLLQQKYDCSERRRTLLHSSTYSPDGKVETVTWETSQQISEPIVPETISEAMLEAVCR